MNKALNILVIAPTPFFADRGCHVRIYEEIRALQKLGHKIILCTYHNGKDIEGIQIERIINVPWYKKEEAGPSYHKIYLDILLLFKVIKLLYKNKINIIHGHLHEGALIGKVASWFRLKKIPCIFDLQGSLTAEMKNHGYLKNKLLFNIFLNIEKIIYKLSDKIIVSTSNNVYYIKKYFKLKNENVDLILDGVDTSKFKPLENTAFKESVLAKYKIRKNRKIIVFLGVLSKYQGVDTLLRAAKIALQTNKNLHFLIMGYPKVDYYKKMAKFLGIQDNVTFTGRIDYSQACDYLNVGDIAISLKIETEANGKLYNYIACGLPVIATNTKVNREILGDNGIYVKVDDPSETAKKIDELIKNESKREILIREGIKKAKDDYSWISIGKKLEMIYFRLLQNKKLFK